MSHAQGSRPGLNGTQAAAEPATRPDPEVVAKAKRRKFSAEYKQRIVQEAAACTMPGQIGALLRREGLYSSNLDKWRKQLARNGQAGLTPQKRGPKVDPQAAEVARLQRENERLQARLERAERIIDVQKKLALLLGMPMDRSDDRW
jgi:transposase